MKPYYWALLAALAWGCAPILEKLGLSKIPVFAGLFYRSLGVLMGATVLIFFQFNTIKQTVAANPQGFWLLMMGGLLASIIGQIFFYHALKDGEASLMVPLAASYPLVSFLLGVIFLGEHITGAKMTGLVFILSGVLLLR